MAGRSRETSEQRQSRLAAEAAQKEAKAIADAEAKQLADDTAAAAAKKKAAALRAGGMQGGGREGLMYKGSSTGVQR